MTKLRVPLIILALVCLSVWTGYAQGQRTGPARQTWEYRVVETSLLESYTPVGDVQKFLNQGGADGWELVRISEHRYYFKRAK